MTGMVQMDNESSSDVNEELLHNEVEVVNIVADTKDWCMMTDDC